MKASDTLDVGKYGLVVEYINLNGYRIYNAMIKMSYYFIFGNCFCIFIIIIKNASKKYLELAFLSVS